MAYATDEQAYKQLFFHFHASLYRFAYTLTHNTEAADDIVSDVMVKLWQMGIKLAYIDNLSSYLFKATKNAALNWLSAQPQPTETLEDWHENRLTAVHNTPEDYLAATETEHQIYAAVAALPRQCQMVFRLVKEEGFSYKQVGTILEVSQNTIETHMRIALKRIRQQLDAYLKK